MGDKEVKVPLNFIFIAAPVTNTWEKNGVSSMGTTFL